MAWLLAAYGHRLERLSISIEGHYGPLSECYGIVPIIVVRGTQSDGAPETRETLSTRELCGYAETLFVRLHPTVRFTRDSGRDVRHVASSQTFARADVSAHRRLELLRRFGSLSSYSNHAATPSWR